MFLSLPITNNSLCSQGSVGLKTHLLCTQTVFVGGTGKKRAMSFDFFDEEVLSNLKSPAISNEQKNQTLQQNLRNFILDRDWTCFADEA